MNKTISVDPRGTTIVFRNQGGMLQLHLPKYSPVARIELVDADAPTLKSMIEASMHTTRGTPGKTYLKARYDVLPHAAAKRLGFKVMPDGDLSLSLYV